MKKKKKMQPLVTCTLFSLFVFLLITSGRTYDFDKLNATSTKNIPFQIATSKCHEYAEARYVKRTFPSFIIDDEPITRRVLECDLSEPLINSGTPSTPGEFPHMAAIGYGNSPVNASWLCGGSLISDRFILSAGSCLRLGGHQGSLAQWARLGAVNLLNVEAPNQQQRPLTFRIIDRIAHPGYNSPFKYNDIALLKLEKSVAYSRYIRPICLHSSMRNDALEFSTAYITGWGAECTGCPESDVMLKAKLTLWNDAKCSKFYAKDPHMPRGFDSETMICAAETIHGRDTCQGDSGGPLQVPIDNSPCTYHQIGIISFGHSMCGVKGVPSVYTEVAPYIPWIQSIVWPLEKS